MNTFYIKKMNCEMVQLDDQDNVMIINLDDSTVTNLNDAGGKCWSLLDKKQSAHTLTQSLLKEHESSPSDQDDVAQLRNDIQAFLDRMVDCGLVKYA